MMIEERAKDVAEAIEQLFVRFSNRRYDPNYGGDRYLEDAREELIGALMGARWGYMPNGN